MKTKFGAFLLLVGILVFLVTYFGASAARLPFTVVLFGLCCTVLGGWLLLHKPSSAQSEEANRRFRTLRHLQAKLKKDQENNQEEENQTHHS